MSRVTTVIVGAGQCGLAMSRELGRRSIDHVVLERGRIGNSWHHERWDSLKLLTPNWMSTPAGHAYGGSDPDGFMSCTDFASCLEQAAALDGAPVRPETSVLALEAFGGGYRVQTDQGAIRCQSVVVATGECALPRIPALAAALPASVVQLTPQSYKRPADVPEGGTLVVGASASGLQIARELAAAGRQVTLAVGNHLRLPRRYRGADILWWMHRIGVFNALHTGSDELGRLRRLPSLPLAGDPSGATLDLNSLQDLGVEIVGRLAALNDGVAWFSGSLANVCASADLKLSRLLDRIDAFADRRGLCDDTPVRLPATRVPASPRLFDGAAKGRHHLGRLGDRLRAGPSLDPASRLRCQGTHQARRRRGRRRLSTSWGCDTSAPPGPRTSPERRATPGRSPRSWRARLGQRQAA